MTKMRTVSEQDKRAALDAVIEVLQQWKQMTDVQTVEVNIDRGINEQLSSEPFKRFEPNGTYTLTVKINGGACGI